MRGYNYCIPFENIRQAKQILEIDTIHVAADKGYEDQEELGNDGAHYLLYTDIEKLHPQLLDTI